MVDTRRGGPLVGKARTQLAAGRRLYPINTIRRGKDTGLHYRLQPRGAAATCYSCQKPIAADRARWCAINTANPSRFHQHCDGGLQAPQQVDQLAGITV